VEMFWFPGHFGVCENKTVVEFIREGTFHQFGLELALGVYKQNKKKSNNKIIK
jgi:hypothetical protein